jgi:hypothetical protein
LHYSQQIYSSESVIYEAGKVVILRPVL